MLRERDGGAEEATHEQQAGRGKKKRWNKETKRQRDKETKK